ncbi:MAG TPA: bifunctional glutamate N-acetyltransferase/amino-acid acetyltransferase ArgJ [Sandaracinaceae bacterium LLY-WYZ-13_1]|nr:bifunctional glutamate N-acetyltransferase/amino-acid acetyltransferase ArgJ [Sandaracinaceae bacterium LLY-WYZ-13_1]
MTESQHPTVPGFRFAARHCGVKTDGALDLGMIVADEPVSVAAMFTKNRVRAAPVELSMQRVERGRAQAIVVNSGNANACTGKKGMEDAKVITSIVADELGVADDMVLMASTGVIGQPLPSERIENALPELLKSATPDQIDPFSRAIMTTDRWPKVSSIKFPIGADQEVTVLGIAKGAGMIHPDMATTLAFVLTDAPMHSTFLKRALHTAVERTFNMLTVDGCTSTNDSVFAMSSSTVDAEPLRGSDRDARRFIDALVDVLGELGKRIVQDGEGAKHVVRLEVVGAPSEDAARLVAEQVAKSLLVKAAIYGRDPNWGRIMAAAGMAGVAFDPNKVEIKFGKVAVVKKGMGVGRDAEEDARRVMSEPSYRIRMKLGPGKAKATYTFCDIGEDYLRLNAAYRT